MSDTIIGKVFDEIRPDYTDNNPVMTGAWASFIQWAFSESDIIAAFEAQTGNRLAVARTPIEAMVDKATGRHEHYIVAFVKWATETMWNGTPEDTRPVWRRNDVRGVVENAG